MRVEMIAELRLKISAAVIEREFSLMPQTADTHGQQVYLRRSGGDVSNGRAAN